MANLKEDISAGAMNEEAQSPSTLPSSGAPTPAPGKAAAFRDRLGKKHEGEQWEDDEALFGRINDDYDDYESQISDLTTKAGDYEKELGGLRENEKKLTDMFAKDPRSATFLMQWRDKGNPVSELVRMYGKDMLEYMTDHPDEMAEQEKEYLERVAKEKEYEDEYNANLSASLDLLDRVQAEKGLSDDEMNGLVDKLISTAHDVIMGKFDEASLDMVSKALGYDKAVAEAEREGEIRGKNTKESERLKLKKAGDGMPRLGGGGGSKPVVEERPELGALNRAGNSNIWERGNETRIKNR